MKFPGENAGILTKSERAERKGEEDKTQAKLEEPRGGFAECFGKWHLNVGPEGKKKPRGCLLSGCSALCEESGGFVHPLSPFPTRAALRWGGLGM